MFRTIFVAGRITAQGPLVKELPDGRVEIATGPKTTATGLPITVSRRVQRDDVLYG